MLSSIIWKCFYTLLSSGSVLVIFWAVAFLLIFKSVAATFYVLWPILLLSCDDHPSRFLFVVLGAVTLSNESGIDHKLLVRFCCLFFYLFLMREPVSLWESIHVIFYKVNGVLWSCMLVVDTQIVVSRSCCCNYIIYECMLINIHMHTYILCIHSTDMHMYTCMW